MPIRGIPEKAKEINVKKKYEKHFNKTYIWGGGSENQ